MSATCRICGKPAEHYRTICVACRYQMRKPKQTHHKAEKPERGASNRQISRNDHATDYFVTGPAWLLDGTPARIPARDVRMMIEFGSFEYGDRLMRDGKTYRVRFGQLQEVKANKKWTIKSIVKSMSTTGRWRLFASPPWLLRR